MTLSLFHHTIRILAVALITFSFAFPAATLAGEFNGIDRKFNKLPEEQKALASRMKDFMKAMDDRYFEQAKDINDGELALEDKDFTTDTSDYNVMVGRGPDVEKIGRMWSYVKEDARENEELSWGRFYSIDVHPKTPLVGMLHATMVMQLYPDGRSFVGGWLGVLPGTKVDEDLKDLKVTMDDVFAEFELDVDFYRDLICVGDPREIRREFRRRPACVGASFYARPPFQDVNKNFDLVSKAFVDFTDMYMETIERRKDQAFTEKDIAAQDEMRKRWLIDQLFSDPFASAIVPFEVWSYANVPPVIKF